MCLPFPASVQRSYSPHSPPLALSCPLSPSLACSRLLPPHAEQALSTVISTPYTLLERKIFSLPKLALLPGVFARHPVLSLVALPLAVTVDGGKSWLAAAITRRIEEHRRAGKKIESTMSRVAAFDLKHSDQITSAGAFALTRERWRELTLARQVEQSKQNILRGLRNWIGWLYWQDVLQPGIEVAIAALLEAGHIGLADVWLYARVIEDAVDMLLMRSRAEAQLAMVVSDANRLAALDDAVAATHASQRVSCSWGSIVPSPSSSDAPLPGKPLLGKSLVHVSCEYSRGTARVKVSPLALPPAIYALSGPNGSGKSTLLSILMSCAHGDGRLRPGISLHTDAESTCAVKVDAAEGSGIVEVHQRPYCPLHCAPIRWLAHGLGGSHETLAAKAAEIAIELRFIGGASSGAPTSSDAASNATAASNGGLSAETKVAAGSGEEGGNGAAAELATAFLSESDDYCGGLSGGQRAKLEVIRSVFLHDACPPLLLMDEPFAALDATSKAALVKKLRGFCPSSVVIVVYHPENDDEDVCEAQRGFFDAVLEVKSGEVGTPRACAQAA